MKNNKFLFITVRDTFAAGVRLLASLLHSHGYTADILIFKEYNAAFKNQQTQISDIEWHIFEKTICEYQPDIIGVSLTSIPVIDEKELFRRLRTAAPSAILSCGGFGPTFEPRRFLEAGADYVIRGEGEGAVLDMVQAVMQGKDLRKIKNFAWLEGNELCENPLRPLVDITNSPYLLSGDEHIMFIENNMLRHVDPQLTLHGVYVTSTSRGCVNHCTYCCGGNWLSLYKEVQRHIKRYRVRPVEQVIQECEYAKKKGAQYIYFTDEYFIRPEKEYFHFFQEYKRRVGLPFGMMVHTAFLDKSKQRFKAFFEAGINEVELGVQSASRHICRDVFQRKIGADLQLRTIKELHAHWVSTSVGFITGHILEEEKDFLDTLAFIKEIPFDPSWPNRTYLAVFSLALLPGARLASLFPELQTEHLSEAEIEFRQRIPYLRHIIKDDDIFFSLYNNKELRSHPELLRTIFRETLARLYYEYWQRTLQRLEGKEVFFWGAGRNYQTHKHWFRKVKPRAMLIDIPTSLSSIDGIPVMHPDEALAREENLPVITFSQSPGFIAAKILQRYPAYSDIITCLTSGYTTLYLN